MYLLLRRKSQNIINKIAPVFAVALILLIWQYVSGNDIVPSFMLPTPEKVIKAFMADFDLLMSHAKTTLIEAFYGLSFGIILGFVTAVIMDRFVFCYKALYPVLIITQTIPTIAIAPLLILWLGYETTPKVVLVVITTFFPITIGLLNGFKSADKDALNLMRAMGANRIQRFWHIKIPSAMSSFFSGLRISVSYSVVGAVISEWLGGRSGLGVYMTRVRKSFAYDKMFAVIIFISALSLFLMLMVNILQKICMPYERKQKNSSN